MDLRMGQRQPREGLGRVAHLGLRRPQELAPHRRVEEQVADLDRRAHRAAARARPARACAADDFQLRAARRVGRCGCEATSRLTSAIDASASPRKPSVRDAEQIVGVANLAGGVAGHGQRQLVGRDAAAVVDDADQLDAALLHRDVDPRRARHRREFSSSSLTTLAGRSITSPAAILLTTLGGSWRMVGMESIAECRMRNADVRMRDDASAQSAIRIPTFRILNSVRTP